MKERNAFISFLKFAFSLIVVVFHCHLLFRGANIFLFSKRGYLAVEFFFIVSGFYFMNGIEKNEKSKKNIYLLNFDNTIKKFKRFVPITLIAGILTCIIAFIFKDIKLSNIFLSIYNSLLVGIVGIGYNLNGPIWYLSAIIVIMFLLYPIIRKNKERYIYYIAPLIVLFGLGYMYKQYPSLDLSSYLWNNLFYSGLLRCLVDINLGILVYEFIKYFNKKMKKIKEKKCKKRIRIILQIIEIVLYLFIFGFMIFAGYKNKNDYFLLLCILCATTITLSEQTYIKKIFSHKFVYYLEKLSLYIYINQKIFITLLSILLKRYDIGYYKFVLFTLIFDIIFSIIEIAIIEKIKKHKA